MLSPTQMKAACALLEWDQLARAEAVGVSLPTNQRLASSSGNLRCNTDSHVKVLEALERGGVEIIAGGAVSTSSGRGSRLK